MLCKVLVLNVKWHIIKWRFDCNKLKIYTKNPKAATKITKQRVIANKPKKEEKWNHKKKLNPKRIKREHRTDETNRKQIQWW